MAKYAKPITIAPWSRYYEDLTIDEKINAKSWGFWRMPNPGGFMLTMIDNAVYDKYEDYAHYLHRHLVPWYFSERPKPKERTWKDTAVGRGFILLKE